MAVPTRRSSRVTLRDVAREVGVHESTVSRVLNEKTRHMVTPEVARRVTQAAEAMGYRPNPIAYSLKTNRTLTVGVVIPDLTNPVFPPIIRGIEDVLADVNYTAIIANTDNDPEKERIILERMRGRRVDGLILGTARLTGANADDLPVVLINRTTEKGDVSSVANDDAAGIRLSVDHLIGLGHTRIAHVAGPETLSTGRSRRQGFIDAMTAGGLDPDPALISAAQAFSEEEGAAAMSAIADRSDDFTAVVAGNDLLAIGCYGVLAERGLKVPEDVSVTGFNDMPFVDKLSPPLTTVRIPHYDMGAEAARILLRHIEEPDAPVTSLLLKRELVVRGSTAAMKPRS